MTALAVARVSLRRAVGDRTTLFFLIVLPLLVVIIIGATTAGIDRVRIGVLVLDDGPQAAALVDSLDAADGLTVTEASSLDALETSVRRAELDAGVVIPAGYDAAIAAGDDVQVGVVGAATSDAFLAARTAIASAVADQGGLVQAGRFATDATGGDLEANVDLARTTAEGVAPVTIERTTVDAEAGALPPGYRYSTPTMLVLFVFINSLAGGAAIIENRRSGRYERMAAAPVARRSIVAGETLAYLAIAVAQSLLIVGVGALGFGVDWGDPLPAVLLVAVWALVGTGTGVLAGTLFRTAEQATSIGPPVGMVAGMLGGCMWPLEIVPPAMAAIGHLTPHAWAVDAWTVLIAQGGGLADIATQLAVLSAFALALLVAATWRLQRHLVA